MHVERRAVRIYDTTEKDFVTLLVEVSIDITKVAENYAAKARKNRSKTAKLSHGAIVVKVTA